jgi:hypothetical protein
MAKTTDNHPPARRHASTVAYATAALFLVFLAVLVFRLEAGLDPAIGARADSPAVQKRRLVIEQRIVEQRERAADPVAPSDSGAGITSDAVPAPAPAPVPQPSTSAS